MSLTSYRAAPPRVGVYGFGGSGPGGDLLFRALRRSTIGAEGLHGRVRDGIGCFAPRYGHQAFRKADVGGPVSEPPQSAATAPPIVRTLLVWQEASCVRVFLKEACRPGRNASVAPC